MCTHGRGATGRSGRGAATGVPGYRRVTSVGAACLQMYRAILKPMPAAAGPDYRYEVLYSLLSLQSYMYVT